MQSYTNNVQDRQGNAIAGAQVLVLKDGATAVIYSDNGITPATNPLTTDANGSFTFYGPTGNYSLTITSPKLPGPVEYVGIPILDPDDFDFTLRDDLASEASAKGSELVAYIPSGTGAVAATVQSKLREFVSVEDFGALGDGFANDTAAIQKAIDAVHAAGGGAVLFKAKTYRVTGLSARSRVKCVGVFGGTVLKAVDGTDSQIFLNPDQFTLTTVDYFGLEGITCDGNKVASAGLVATSACAVNGVKYFYAKDCVFQNATGYGLAFQARPASAIAGEQSNIYLENCHFLNNGDGVGGDTYDGLDIKDCDKITLVGCTASGNSDRGFNIRGEYVSLLACNAISNGYSGFEIAGNSDTAGGVRTTCRLVSCEARSNGAILTGPGFAFSNGSGTGTALVQVTMIGCNSYSNTGDGVEVNGTANYLELIGRGLSTCNNGRDGVRLRQTTKLAIFSGGVSLGNSGSGVFTDMAKAQISDYRIGGNARYGVEEGANGTRTIVGGSTVVDANTLGRWLFNANGRYHIGPTVIDYDAGETGGDIIASASAITLPEGGAVFAISGTTNIDAINSPGLRNRIVTLYFLASLTVNNLGTGGNIRLAGGANKAVSNRDSLTLLYIAGSWVEIAFTSVP